MADLVPDPDYDFLAEPLYSSQRHVRTAGALWKLVSHHENGVAHNDFCPRLSGLSVSKSDAIKTEGNQAAVPGPPWSAVGKLYNGTGAGCTAIAVEPDQVLTAAHCAFNRRTGFFCNQVRCIFYWDWTAMITGHMPWSRVVESGRKSCRSAAGSRATRMPDGRGKASNRSRDRATRALTSIPERALRFAT